jgi:hypothetical protein
MAAKREKNAKIESFSILTLKILLIISLLTNIALSVWHMPTEAAYNKGVKLCNDHYQAGLKTIGLGGVITYNVSYNYSGVQYGNTNSS